MNLFDITIETYGRDRSAKDLVEDIQKIINENEDKDYSIDLISFLKGKELNCVFKELL